MATVIQNVCVPSWVAPSVDSCTDVAGTEDETKLTALA